MSLSGLCKAWPKGTKLKVSQVTEQKTDFNATKAVVDTIHSKIQKAGKKVGNKTRAIHKHKTNISTNQEQRTDQGTDEKHRNTGTQKENRQRHEVEGKT